MAPHPLCAARTEPCGTGLAPGVVLDTPQRRGSGGGVVLSQWHGSRDERRHAAGLGGPRGGHAWRGGAAGGAAVRCRRVVQRPPLPHPHARLHVLVAWPSEAHGPAPQPSLGQTPDGCGCEAGVMAPPHPATRSRDAGIHLYVTHTIGASSLLRGGGTAQMPIRCCCPASVARMRAHHAAHATPPHKLEGWWTREGGSPSEGFERAVGLQPHPANQPDFERCVIASHGRATEGTVPFAR
jgi:hypothetical protein